MNKEDRNRDVSEKVTAVIIILAVMSAFAIVVMVQNTHQGNDIVYLEYQLKTQHNALVKILENSQIRMLNIAEFRTANTSVTLYTGAQICWAEIMLVEIEPYCLADVYSDCKEIALVYECEIVSGIQPDETPVVYTEYCIFSESIPQRYDPIEVKYIIVPTELGDIWYFI